MGNFNGKWGSIVPLIGGCTLGASLAAGTDPSVIFSYPPFYGNDRHAINRWPNSPYIVLDPEQNDLSNILLPRDADEIFEGIEFVNAVCPCAGLSALTSNSSCLTGEERHNNPQNQWMTKTAEFVLDHVKPKVFWGENAPALFTYAGQGVVDRLWEIAKKFGYAFSIIKTSTSLHGLPQRRMRTFYFFWKAETVPIFPQFDREMPSFIDFFDGWDPTGLPHHGTFANRRPLSENGFYLWMKHKFGDQWRSPMAKYGSVISFANNEGYLEECADWLEGCGSREAKDARRSVIKFAAGGNVWDNSPHVFQKGHIAAVQGRVFQHAVHPKEDRYLSVREHMRLMGLPDDFNLVDESNIHCVTQNVPVNTSRDMAAAVISFINGELKMSSLKFLKQDLTKQKMIPVKSRVSSLARIFGDG